MAADPSVFARPEVRDAINLLREHGVTPEQYATVNLVPCWSVSGKDYPDRQAAFAAAQAEANTGGQWAEVWCAWPATDWAAESWIVKPERRPWCPA